MTEQATTSRAGRPRVSVLMTAFNRERYIAEAIESVLAQTFTDFELVIVDDTSKDDTLAIAHDYASRDRRIRVFANPQNLGDYPNRNHAATLVQGELFKYHDSDDVMYAHCLATMVAGMDTAPSADFALTTSRPWAGGQCPMLLTPRQCYAREYLGEGMFHLGPACALFRRTSFERLGPFPLERTVSDYFFWRRACRTANVVLVAADLFWYRTHDGQEVRSAAAREDNLRIERAAWEALFESDCPLTGDELLQARRNRLTGLVRRSLAEALQGDWRTAMARVGAAHVKPGDWLRYFGGRRLDLQAGTPSLHDA